MNKDKRATVLLVDDRPDNLLVLQAILQSLGHQFLTATSGEEALKHLLTHDCAVIVMDVQMPGIDGFETAEHIKRRERTRHIPIVFLTALDRDAHHAFRGYAAGAVDYLAKPFDPWILRAKVAVFVELWEKNRLLLTQAEELRRQLLGQTAERSARMAALSAARERVVQAISTCLADGTPAELTSSLQDALRHIDQAITP